MERKTRVGVEGDSFLVDGEATYAGRSYGELRVEGLLMNSRMVQGIFDDLNPETRGRWDYPDGPWDPERNTREFVAAMPDWRSRGLLGFTINLQGGNPLGYSKDQPWHNSAFDDEGGLRPEYMDRLERILNRADGLGMVPILGYFYFGQEWRFGGEADLVRAAENATDWLLQKGYTNVLIEIGNEVDHGRYRQDLVKVDRVDELIRLVQERSAGTLDTPAGRLLVSASLCGGNVPPDALAEAADFILLHGNGVSEPDGIREMVRDTRDLEGYHGCPIVFNEDDHYAFGEDDNNMLAAVESGAGWGFFDWRHPGEGYDDGYQSVPVNWQISSPRKQAFFDLLARMTGA